MTLETKGFYEEILAVSWDISQARLRKKEVRAKVKSHGKKAVEVSQGDQ